MRVNLLLCAAAFLVFGSLSTSAQVAPGPQSQIMAAAPAPTSERRVLVAESGWGKPYAHPGGGDDDGLSRDEDDCNKGCIDGNSG
jgi:hypothetical protein